MSHPCTHPALSNSKIQPMGGTATGWMKSGVLLRGKRGGAARCVALWGRAKHVTHITGGGGGRTGWKKLGVLPGGESGKAAGRVAFRGRDVCV